MYLHVVLGIISGLFWVWFFFVKTPLKGKLFSIIKVFFWGMAAALAAALAEGFIFRFFPFMRQSSHKIISFFQMFCIVAPLEEYCKCVALEATVYKTEDLSSPREGVVFAIACALGFGAMENVFYFVSYEGYRVIAVRSFLSILGHASFSGVMGYYMGLAKLNKEREQKLVMAGLFMAILLHGLYNFLISTNTALSFLIYPEVLIIILFLENQIKKQQTGEQLKQSAESKIYLMIIPVLLISLGCFFFKNQREKMYEGKNIIEYEKIYKLYEGASILKVEKILGHPAQIKEFFGRNEILYIYYYKDKFGDYKVLKLVFLEGKLKIEESF